MDGGIGSGLIVGGIFKLMELLYRSVEGVAANRELCESLALRVKVIEGAIKALEVTPLSGYALASPLTQLQTTLQSAIMLVKEQSSKSKVLLFLQGSTVRGRFDELHRRLSQCQIDLSIPFEADTRAALASIMQQQQETAATIEALAATLSSSLPAQVAAAIQEGLAKRRAFPAPGGRAPAAAITSPLREDDGAGAHGTTAAVLQSDASRPAWLLDYDALHFELDKRGRRRELGRGSSAVVYRALYYGQPVAVKVISAVAAGLHDPAHRAVFDKELQTCFSLRHPNISTVLGGTAPSQAQIDAVVAGTAAEEDVPEFAIVMEQEHTSLAAAAAAAAAGAATEQAKDDATNGHRRTLRTLRGIASALVYLHVARPKIVHCDLKPANVLLDADGNPKLTDFGVAATRGTTVSGSGAAQQAGGWTEAYAAPEVLRDPTQPPDERADVYSFGVVALELLKRGAAWPAGTAVRQHVLGGGKLPVPDGVAAPAIVAIIRACLRDAPADRPYAVDLVAALAAPESDLLSHEAPATALGTKLPAIILRAPIAAAGHTASGASSAADEDASVKARLTRFYEHYAPDRVANVASVMRMYDGRYPDMFERLVAKYGSEPAVTAPPSSSTKKPSLSGTLDSLPPSSPLYRGGASEQRQHQALRDRLSRFYVAHDSSKLANVDEIILRFHDVEGDLFARLVEKYGPEPAADRSGAPPSSTGDTEDVTPVAHDDDDAHPPTRPRDASPPSSTALDSVAAAAGSGKGGDAMGPPEKDASQVAQALVRSIPQSARVQLLQFYEYHAPDKVQSVDKVLARFAGREDELFATLAVLYGSGPELVPAESGL